MSEKINVKYKKCRWGILIKKEYPERQGIKPLNRKTRGKISAFSSYSAQRMREKIVTLPDDKLYSVTMTISANYYKDAEDLRKFWHKFDSYLRYAIKKCELSPKCYFVWRIELQKNRTPHWHCIFKVENEEDLIAIRRTYCRLIQNHFGYQPCPEIAVDIQQVTSEGIMSYISAHASKKKKDQLGWLGRQWGIKFLSREAREEYDSLVSSDQTFHNFEKATYFNFLRFLRRLYFSYFRGKGKFSCKKMNRWGEIVRVSSRYQCYRQSKQSVNFLSSQIVNKIVNHLEVA